MTAETKRLLAILDGDDGKDVMDNAEELAAELRRLIAENGKLRGDLQWHKEEDAKDTARIQDLLAAAWSERDGIGLKITREWQQVIAWLAEDVMGSLETVKELDLGIPGHPYFHGKMSVLRHFRELADEDEKRFLGEEHPHA